MSPTTAAEQPMTKITAGYRNDLRDLSRAGDSAAAISVPTASSSTRRSKAG
jgi:hypothetical protein